VGAGAVRVQVCCSYNCACGCRHQENWFLLYLDLNGSKCIYSTIDATIASISLIESIDI
jgi:hypothetical protein